MGEITRFAPSPTGRLHAGHAFSALFAYEAAMRTNGTFLLRFEDIDPVRCKRPYEAGICEDLRWLGLSWPEPVRRQSDHMAWYRKHLETLEDFGLLYPCFCTRADIHAEIARAGHAPHGIEGTLYPGTCRSLDHALSRALQDSGKPFVLRLDMVQALQRVKPGSLRWHDRSAGWQDTDPAFLIEQIGDIVLARKDVPTCYHLSVTLDDHAQGISCVTRGMDLFHATPVHRLLQALLGLDVPRWHHHPLLYDTQGRRLSKRDKSLTLAHAREHGLSPHAFLVEYGVPESLFPAPLSGYDETS